MPRTHRSSTVQGLSHQQINFESRTTCYRTAMKQYPLLVAFALVVGILTLAVYDRWRLPGAAVMIGGAVAAHALALRRQSKIEKRMADLLSHMSDQKIREEMAAMDEPDRAEVVSALAKIGRKVPPAR
jgi:hypothetical protein